LFERTRATLEPLYGRALSDDEISEILTNMGQLFRALFDSDGSTARAAVNRDRKT
jgi:hypothetical protein